MYGYGDIATQACEEDRRAGPSEETHETKDKLAAYVRPDNCSHSDHHQSESSDMVEAVVGDAISRHQTTAEHQCHCAIDGVNYDLDKAVSKSQIATALMNLVDGVALMANAN